MPKKIGYYIEFLKKPKECLVRLKLQFSKIKNFDYSKAKKNIYKKLKLWFCRWKTNKRILFLGGALIIGDGNYNITGSSLKEFNGQLDDIRIFRYTVEAAKVRTIMNEGAVRFGPASGAP